MHLEVAVDLIVPQVNTTDAIAARSLLFTGGVGFASNRFLAYFLATYAHIFDGEPAWFDPAVGVPEEQLQVSIPNKTGDLGLLAFADRIEFRQFRSGAAPLDLAWHASLASRLFDGYRGLLPLGAAHVGCDVLWSTPLEHAAQTIAGYFCSERWVIGPLAGLNSYEFVAKKPLLVGGILPVEGLFRCGSDQILTRPRASSPPPPASTVLFEQSLRTTGAELGPAQIFDFFRLAPEELSKNLRNFFPPEEGELSR